MWGDFSEGVSKLVPEGETFDYVFDNYAKDVGTCDDLAQKAKAWCVPHHLRHFELILLSPWCTMRRMGALTG